MWSGPPTRVSDPSPLRKSARTEQPFRPQRKKIAEDHTGGPQQFFMSGFIQPEARCYSVAMTRYIIMKWNREPARIKTWKISWQPNLGLFRPGHLTA